MSRPSSPASVRRPYNRAASRCLEDLMDSRFPLRRRSLLAAAPLLALPAIARAQATWKPTQALRFVVPAAPGGGTDILARMIGNHLQQKWGVSVVIDNKSGAGGVVGTMEVVRSAPDGHTMLMGNIGPQSIAYS